MAANLSSWNVWAARINYSVWVTCCCYCYVESCPKFRVPSHMLNTYFVCTKITFLPVKTKSSSDLFEKTPITDPFTWWSPLLPSNLEKVRSQSKRILGCLVFLFHLIWKAKTAVNDVSRTPKESFFGSILVDAFVKRRVRSRPKWRRHGWLLLRFIYTFVPSRSGTKWNRCRVMAWKCIRKKTTFFAFPNFASKMRKRKSKERQKLVIIPNSNWVPSGKTCDKNESANEERRRCWAKVEILKPVSTGSPCIIRQQHKVWLLLLLMFPDSRERG